MKASESGFFGTNFGRNSSGFGQHQCWRDDFRVTWTVYVDEGTWAWGHVTDSKRAIELGWNLMFALSQRNLISSEFLPLTTVVEQIFKREIFKIFKWRIQGWREGFCCAHSLLPPWRHTCFQALPWKAIVQTPYWLFSASSWSCNWKCQSRFE